MSTRTTTLPAYQVFSLSPAQYMSELDSLKGIVEKYLDLGWTDDLSQKIASWGLDFVKDTTNLIHTQSFTILDTPQAQSEAVRRIEKLMNKILAMKGQTLCNPVIDEADHVWEEDEVLPNRNENNNLPSDHQRPTGMTRPHLFARDILAWVQSVRPNPSRILRLRTDNSSVTTASSPSSTVSHPTIMSSPSSSPSFSSFGSDPRLLNHVSMLTQQLRASQQRTKEKMQKANAVVAANNQRTLEFIAATKRKTEEWQKESEKRVSEHAKEVEGRLATIEENHQKEREQIVRENQELVQENQELRGELKEFQGRLSRAQQAQTQQSQEMASLKNEAVQLNQKCEKLEKKLKNVAKKKKKSCAVM